jgi:flagellar FliL protein
MSAAVAADAAAPPKGKKKLILIIAAAVLVLALGGTAALLLLKKKPAEDEGDDDAAHDAPAKAVKHDPKAQPVFVPLDPFTVNLADRHAERYAQIGITLEIGDAKLGDQIKIFMPAIRHGILMIIADKTAAQLMDREGKLKLAREVQRETSRALGYEVADDVHGDDAEADADAPPKKGRKKARKKAPELPIKAVHFSNFIIQ